jgi:hypothetical protein
MERRKDDTRESLKRKALRGEHVFLFTDVQKGSWYEYEYVNTGEVFTRPEMPSTYEEIQKTGHTWLQYKDELKERTAKMFGRKQKQTTLPDFLK